jgi:putative signal transducing protein
VVTDLVEAARFNSRVEADLARLYLDSEGVDAVLFDTEINYTYGGLFLPMRLMVLDEDLDLALRLLAEKAR